uniref:Uncharacterized protein n=1 Tax=Rhizophora mucronata TaxID=61149 RepID=A0A2P2ITD4_RHIMU
MQLSLSLSLSPTTNKVNDRNTHTQMHKQLVPCL